MCAGGRVLEAAGGDQQPAGPGALVNVTMQIFFLSTNKYFLPCPGVRPSEAGADLQPRER